MRDRMPSRTAMQAAMVRALESARGARSRLFDDPYAIRFLPAGYRLLIGAVGWFRLAGLLERYVDARQPAGPRGYTVVRTRLIDDLVVAGIEAGAGQVVLLGAGYDSRPYRLPELAKVMVFEVDHPDTQRHKRALLERTVDAARWSGVRFVPVDFAAQDLAGELRQAGFDEGAPTVVVWEGVAAYLTADVVHATLDWVAASTAPGSRLLFTYLEQSVVDGASEAAGAAQWSANARAGGEPLSFAFGPQNLAGDLSAHGLDLIADVPAPQAAARYLAPLGRTDKTSPVSHIVHAEVTAGHPGTLGRHAGQDISGIIDLGEAGIFYEATGSGPAVLGLAGGGAGGTTLHKIGAQLAGRFRFITYDRRGTLRSPGLLDRDLDMAEQADDVVRVLDALGEPAAVVFGTCGGASIGFELVRRHPDRVIAYIAHEPMMLRVLDDADEQMGLVTDILATNETEGAWPATMKWMRFVGRDFQMVIRPVFKQRILQHGAEMIRYEVMPMVSYLPDFDALRATKLPIIMAVGDGSRAGGYPYARTVAAIADKLNCPTLTFPGHHQSYVYRPDEFADALAAAVTALLTDA